MQLTNQQKIRNALLYTSINWLLYVCAPVIYVGITHAILCNALGASDFVANLPASACFWTAAVPLIVAWRFHTLAVIKPVLITCNVMIAMAGMLVAASLYWPTPAGWRVSLIILYAVLVGGAVGTLNPFSWELLGRGVDQKHRGLALTLSYGVGPILAVVGSLGAQLILCGSIEIPWISSAGEIEYAQFSVAHSDFPNNFAILFFLTTPLFALAAYLSGLVILPTGEAEQRRYPLMAGLARALRGMLGDPVMRTALVAYLLIDAGCAVLTNMSLYSALLLGGPSENYAGYQNALRFSFKVVAGIFLGWLVRRTHALAGMLTTAGLALGGIACILFMPQGWILICFGLLGAAELYGVYYPNFIATRSPTDQVRHNIAVMQLCGMVTSLAPGAFGAIAEAFGFPASFMAAGLLVMASIMLIILRIPVGDDRVCTSSH